MTGRRHFTSRAPLPFFAAALALLATAACSKKPDRPQRQVALVTIAPVRRATVPYIIESNGIVTPLQTVTVTSQVDGIVQSVDFQEGQEVRQGQVLFHIDPRPYQNAVAQAQAVLARDSASWLNAKANAQRAEELLKAKVITPVEAATDVTGEATAQATLRADLAALSQAQFNLDNAVIRTPIAGRTGNLLVKRGNLVRSGATQLVVINQVRPIYVRFSIPSSELPLVLQYGAAGGLAVAAVPGGVAPATPSIDSLAAAAMNPVGDPPGEDGGALSGGGGGSGGRRGGGARGSEGSRGGEATPGGSAQQAGALAGPATPPTGERLMGKLSFIDNAIDTSTQTVQLKATFDNSNGRLWAGQFTATSLHLFDEDSALVVPQQAIVNGQRGMYVYVVDQADTARQRAVAVERMEGGLAIIASGVREGDRVVTDGQSRLTPDAPVRIRGANDLGGSPGARSGRRGRRGGGGAGGSAGGASANGGGSLGGAPAGAGGGGAGGRK